MVMGIIDCLVTVHGRADNYKVFNSIFKISCRRDESRRGLYLGAIGKVTVRL